MAEVLGVRFKEGGKIYYFDPDGKEFSKGSKVIVETVRGIECGEAAVSNHTVSDEEIIHPLKKVIRAANADDIKTVEMNRKTEGEAFAFCEKKVVELGLDMKLVEVECTFDGSKMLFYFTSDDRVDFRELVKDLAGVFRTRIELRQIGVRDETKILGGIGIVAATVGIDFDKIDLSDVQSKLADDEENFIPVALESVKNAMENPYQVTQSKLTK